MRARPKRATVLPNYIPLNWALSRGMTLFCFVIHLMGRVLIPLYTSYSNSYSLPRRFSMYIASQCRPRIKTEMRTDLEHESDGAKKTPPHQHNLFRSGFPASIYHNLRPDDRHHHPRNTVQTPSVDSLLVLLLLVRRQLIVNE